MCRLARRSVGKQLGVERKKSRCRIGKQVIGHSVISPGMFDVKVEAHLNLDKSIEPEKFSKRKAWGVGKAAGTAASDFVVKGALSQSEAPSSMPSMHPSISFIPTIMPSFTSGPTSQPSEAPSMLPSLSSVPTTRPSMSSVPTGVPSTLPTVTSAPSDAPSVSIQPTISFEPTPSPTARRVFEEEFHSTDIGYVGYAGQSYEAASGLYTVQGSGNDIYGSSDNFHYMYLETSGDATFTALIEGLGALDSWAKGGIMVRSSLSASSSHYSMYLTKSQGLAQQYRACATCTTYHHGTLSSYGSVWLRVVKQGNLLRAFYKPSYVEKNGPWTQFGHELSMNSISSNGYYIGIAVTSRSNDAVASLDVSNIQLERSCINGVMTEQQCDQASNCEWGSASQSCYNKGEVPYWEYGEGVGSIFDTGSTVTAFGCDSGGSENRATDRTTYKFHCDWTQNNGTPRGLIITPFHGRASIARGLRLYAGNNCPSCDPVAYQFEGRANVDSGDWVMIGEGDLPWKITSNDGNNVEGFDITSTYASGDPNYSHTEVAFENYLYYKQYRLTLTEFRNAQSKKMQFAEVEVPGLLAEEHTMATLNHAGNYTANILDTGAGVSYFGSFHISGTIHQLVDRTTNKVALNREGFLTETPGIVVTPTHGMFSIVTGMRIFTANNNPGADPVKYSIQGRYQSGSIVQDRMHNKCWELSPEIGNKVILTGACDDANPNQRFYVTADNEIRVNGAPEHCLDMRLDGVVSVYFHPCNSGDNQKWTIDPATEEIRSMHDNACLDHDTNSGNLWFHSCHGGSEQKFYMNESFDSTLPTAWTDIASGHLPWISEYDRNPLALPIESTYESADDGHFYMEVTFYDNSSPYMDYRISFPELRDPNSLSLQFAEIELPGLIVEQ